MRKPPPEGHWTWLENETILQSAKIGPTAITVLLVLAMYANGENQCFPSVEKIGNILGIHPKSVRRSLIDDRYNDCKPTLVTMNVADGKEADTKLGSPILDRLRHGAITIKCEWPSYRKCAGPTGKETA
jgi:hypothetical protein